jgi:SAM-dependent methyltransferase
VMGVEPNEVLAAKAAQRLGQERVRNTTLQEADLPLASFNAITLWDVLEHVVSPPDFLRLCAGLLKPRGVVIAKVPDLDSWHARLMGNKWPLFLPEHLGYFTKRSVTVSADKAGLRVVCFGRSAVTFSLGYILLRAGQHGVPMAQACHRAIGDGFLGTLPISIRLGELYVTLTASPSHQRTGDSQ